VNRTVIADYTTQPGVQLAYYTSGGNGDGGDQYTGIDRFDRVTDQRWHKAGTDKERVKTFRYSIQPMGDPSPSNRQTREGDE
jgi:hypothetical protein